MAGGDGLDAEVYGAEVVEGGELDYDLEGGF